MKNQKQFNGKNANKSGFPKPEDVIIRSLKSDPVFCYNFFFCSTRTKKYLDGETPCDAHCVRDAIIQEILKRYNYNLKPKDCSSILYETIWDEGRFGPLDSYDKKGPFDGWLYKVGLNAVTHRLKSEALIPRTVGRTAGNTRLTMRSQPMGVCETVIDDLITDSVHKQLLMALYVDRLSDEEARIKMGMDPSEFDYARKDAERSLKEALLLSDHPYKGYVLHDKSSAASASTVDVEDLHGSNASDKPAVYVRIFGDVLGINLEECNISVTVVVFLDNFIMSLPWSDNDRYLWRERFINGTAPTTLAQELGHSRNWVDTRYHRLNKMFEHAIRKWWQLNAA